MFIDTLGTYGVVSFCILIQRQSLVSYFLPILRQVPVFGVPAARDWLWSLDISPAYVGYGIIIGPSVTAYMLIGAIIGWGILSPVAKYQGWAPGPVGDWENGSRAWILWVGMGLILGDTIVGLGWISLKPSLLWAWRAARERLRREVEPAEQVPLLRDGHDEVEPAEESSPDDGWPSWSLPTNSLLLWVGAGLFTLYLVSLLVAFQKLVTGMATLFALLLIPLAGFISMRSLGETDNGASLAIGRYRKTGA